MQYAQQVCIGCVENMTFDVSDNNINLSYYCLVVLPCPAQTSPTALRQWLLSFLLSRYSIAITFKTKYRY